MTAPLTEMVMAHATGAALAPVTRLTGLNPLTTALVVGDQHDQKIDATMARQASNGVTFARTVAAIIANPSASNVFAAPLRPSANSCAWLRSGTYRMVSPFASDARWRSPVMALNASTLTITDQDGVPGNLAPLVLRLSEYEGTPPIR